MGGSRYTVILRANENVGFSFKVADYNLKVSWITTSDSVENAYLLHSDVILQIQARWITSDTHRCPWYKRHSSSGNWRQDKPWFTWIASIIGGIPRYWHVLCFPVLR
jgi:hypothetical protein